LLDLRNTTGPLSPDDTESALETQQQHRDSYVLSPSDQRHTTATTSLPSFSSEARAFDHRSFGDTLSPQHNDASHHDTFRQSPSQEPDVLPYRCASCPRAYSMRRDLNHHINSHTRPFKCPVQTCGWGFQFKKDLTRHCKDMHPDTVPDYMPLYCPVEECKSSEGKGGGFSRRDNLRRHVRTRHPEVDVGETSV